MNILNEKLTGEGGGGKFRKRSTFRAIQINREKCSLFLYPIRLTPIMINIDTNHDKCTLYHRLKTVIIRLLENIYKI